MMWPKAQHFTDWRVWAERLTQMLERWNSVRWLAERLEQGTGVTLGYNASKNTITISADGVTDLGYSANTRLLTSSTGADVTLPLVTSTEAGLAPPSGGGTNNFLRADGTWAAPSVASLLQADVINDNATANTLADVTGLSFPVTTGRRYWFSFQIYYTAAATSTGSRWSINGPTFTRLAYWSSYSLTATSVTTNGGLDAYDLPVASNASSANTAGNIAKIEGFIEPSADGSVIARFASEVANSAITAKAGSFVQWLDVT